MYFSIMSCAKNTILCLYLPIYSMRQWTNFYPCCSWVDVTVIIEHKKAWSQLVIHFEMCQLMWFSVPQQHHEDKTWQTKQISWFGSGGKRLAFITHCLCFSRSGCVSFQLRRQSVTESLSGLCSLGVFPPRLQFFFFGNICSELTFSCEISGLPLLIIE